VVEGVPWQDLDAIEPPKRTETRRGNRHKGLGWERLPRGPRRSSESEKRLRDGGQDDDVFFWRLRVSVQCTAPRNNMQPTQTEGTESRRHSQKRVWRWLGLASRQSIAMYTLCNSVRVVTI
jgi:hypothetical protein